MNCLGKRQGLLWINEFNQYRNRLLCDPMDIIDRKISPEITRGLKVKICTNTPKPVLNSCLMHGEANSCLAITHKMLNL